MVGPLVWPWEPLEIAAPADVIVHLRDGALGYARIVDVERADR